MSVFITQHAAERYVIRHKQSMTTKDAASELAAHANTRAHLDGENWYLPGLECVCIIRGEKSPSMVTVLPKVTDQVARALMMRTDMFGCRTREVAAMRRLMHEARRTAADFHREAARHQDAARYFDNEIRNLGVKP